VLRALRDDLDGVIAALADTSQTGALRTIAESIGAGNAGVARLPGKHGQSKTFTQVIVMVDDAPGELGRLLTEMGEIGINLEDLRLEHSPGAQFGLAEVSVVPEHEEQLIEDLVKRGWTIAGT
jgi:prephenate dehydrogenase